MIQMNTMLNICDKTSVVLGICIKIIGRRKYKLGTTGNMIIISIRWINPKKQVDMKPRLRRKYSCGVLHRALIVRTKIQFRRATGCLIKFNENAAILINKKYIPLSTRIYGPMLRELCLR